jgi:hypothetical protein
VSLQSKHISHDKSAKGRKSGESIQEPSVSEHNGPVDREDLLLQQQSTLGKTRDFTWDSTFPFPFVVVFSHAAVTFHLREKGLGSRVSAEGHIGVKDLQQGTSTHTVTLMKSKEKEVQLQLM